jgi:enoyl-CoA hydratase
VSGSDSDALLAEGSPVRVLTFNRPDRRNAVDGELHEALLSAVLSIPDNQDIRVVVLTGAGQAFSAGGDFGLIEQMQQDIGLRKATLETSRLLFWAMMALEVPVVAAVNGPAVGAGATIALLSDIVVMDESAYLAEPRVGIGLVPGDGGSILWPLLAGIPAARAYLLTGEHMPAAEAFRLGLIHKVARPNSAFDEAMILAERLASLSPHSVRTTKRALNRHLEEVAREGLELDLQAESESFDTPHLLALIRKVAERRSATEDV